MFQNPGAPGFLRFLHFPPGCNVTRTDLKAIYLYIYIYISILPLSRFWLHYNQGENAEISETLELQGFGTFISCDYLLGLRGGGTLFYDSYGRPIYSEMTEPDAEQGKGENNCGQRSLAWLMVYKMLGESGARAI